MDGKTIEELKRFLKKNNASGYSKMNKEELVKYAKKVQRGSANNNMNVNISLKEQLKNTPYKNLQREYIKIKTIKNTIHGAPTITRSMSIMDSTPQNARNEQHRAIMIDEISRFYDQYKTNKNYRNKVNKLLNENSNEVMLNASNNMS